MAHNGNRPVKTLRLRGLSASIFANRAKRDGREVTFHKVSLQRVYRDGDEWKTTQSLGRDDLLHAAVLLYRAWEFILEAGTSGEDDDGK